MQRVLNVIIDLPDTAAYHRATIDAVRHAIDARNADVAVRVVRTPEIDAAFRADPGDGVVIGPGSPYDVPLAADEVIRTARERGLPLVAT